jgi:hypothetical protein
VKPGLLSARAVVAGLTVTVVASTAMDAVLTAIGLLPREPRLVSNEIFVVAAAYRAVFTIAGAYLTARLSPGRIRRDTTILAAIGLAAGLAGLAAFLAMKPGDLGPAWYAVAIPLEAIPCVWLGARLAGRGRTATVPSD